MKIAHDKYDAESEYCKVRDPSFTLKRVDRDYRFVHYFEEYPDDDCDKECSKIEISESADKWTSRRWKD